MSTPFEISDRFVDEAARLSPLLATSLGLPGHDHEWGNAFSLAGWETRIDMARRYRDEMRAHLDHPDPAQRLAARVVVRLVDEQVEGFEAGDHLRDLAHMASSFQRIVAIFDMMPTATAGAWEAISERLETIRRPLDGLRERLEEGIRQGVTVSRRQVLSVIDQARALAGDDSAFRRLEGAAAAAGHPSPRLTSAIWTARGAVGDLAGWLEESYLPHADAADGVGEERYRRFADRLVGIRVDPAEAYEWGWSELARIEEEMEAAGRDILPGSDLPDVVAHLESDPERAAPSPEAFVEFIEGVLHAAVTALAGVHFDVDDRIRPLTVNIAPPGRPLGAYYLRPSEDFTRPGGVWYSIGDQTVFPLYHHVSTAYHEGFPGHHLQIGTAMARREHIGRVQRVLSHRPGYGEGWAMYAERLMGELGFLDDPAHRFGMLGKHRYRAARVVVDIGLHLGYRIPRDAPFDPGGRWTVDGAVEFMRVFGLRTPEQARSDVLRYLGWPGQAIAYKLGEREILSIRQDARHRLGDSFDLRAFHDAVIGNGPMRLDLLREVVEDELG